MSDRRRRPSPRVRVGKVSVYLHHGTWWLYYREQGRPVRNKVSESRDEAEQVAAQVNAQLAQRAPTLLSFQPVGVPDLRRQFLDHHEHVLRSSVGTLRRYRSATQHLEDFVASLPRRPQAHEVSPDAFAAYLRRIEVAPNGHGNSSKRRLRDKGVRFILETCRSMYGYAVKRRHLPPYVGNPFSELPLDRMKVEDAKPIFVFDAAAELAFFRAASDWGFPVHFTLAKTGLRVGELVHLLVEDVDLEGGWLHVRNKIELGWRIKTGQERVVPLLPEVVAVLRRAVGRRKGGLVFLRQRLAGGGPELAGDREQLEHALRERVAAARGEGAALPRADAHRVARKVWWDAGAVKADVVRCTFVRVMRALGWPAATCPKSWRYTFATLLQDGNVDPLLRQQVMGHRPTASGGLGMTAKYTHTRPETLRQQVEAALRRWPEGLRLAAERAG